MKSFRKTTKWIAVLLCLTMIIGCFAGCGSKQEEPAAQTEKTEQTTETTKTEETAEAEEEAADEIVPGELPLTTDPDATITIGITTNALVEDYDTNAFTKYIEENTGVNLEFVYLASTAEESQTQLTMMMSSGEKLPDILFGTIKDEVTSIQYGREGYLVNLKPYFEQYAHYFYEGYDKVPSESDKALIMSLAADPVDGAMYAFPYYSVAGGDAIASLTTINQEWLKAVGAEKPTTTEELYEVLVKFRDEDPNGNGKQDEIPMLSYPGYRAKADLFLINAFVYCVDDYMWNVTDGKLWSPYSTDEYREAMIYINKLVSEGLLSTLTFTLDDSADSELMALYTPSDGTALAGVVSAHPTLTMEEGNDLIYEYTSLEPLAAVTDKGGYGAMAANKFSYDVGITTDCEDPVLAFRLLDFMSSQESAHRGRLGEYGVNWTDADEGGAVATTGEPATAKIISDPWGKQGNVVWQDAGNFIDGWEFMSTQGTYGDDWPSARSMLFKNLYQGYKTAGQPKERFTLVSYTDEENEIISELQTIYKDYVEEARALFATGTLDPNNDADWEEYLANLEVLGESQLLECAQAAYDRMN